MVVCGGIGEILRGMIEDSNIRVIPGVFGDIDDVLAVLIAGEFPHPCFVMPGRRPRLENINDGRC